MKAITVTNCLLAVVAVLTAFGIGSKASPVRFGSAAPGNDYQATTTRSFNGTALTNFTVVKARPGTLARVTVTGAGTGIIRLWDATTTDAVSGRASGLASSSIQMWEIPASAAANTYDFDAEFRYGLLYELVSGTVGTTTFIYR